MILKTSKTWQRHQQPGHSYSWERKGRRAAAPAAVSGDAAHSDGFTCDTGSLEPPSEDTLGLSGCETSSPREVSFSRPQRPRDSHFLTLMRNNVSPSFLPPSFSSFLSGLRRIRITFLSGSQPRRRQRPGTPVSCHHHDRNGTLTLLRIWQSKPDRAGTTLPIGMTDSVL